MKTVMFFNACNDIAAVEALRDEPLRKLIDDMGGWNVTGNMKSLSSMDITQRIGKVSRELFIKPFIDVKVFIDPHDSNKHILQVSRFASIRWKTLIVYHLPQNSRDVDDKTTSAGQIGKFPKYINETS